jgi:hypothetical protein
MIILRERAQIIEDCLPPSLFKKLQSNLMNFDRNYFYFAEGTAYNGGEMGPPSLLDSSFFHNMIIEGEPCSPYSEMVHDAILVACDRAGRTVDKITRARLGLVTATESTFTHEKHIDFSYPHTTGLLYLNSSDGDTTLYSSIHEEGLSIFEQAAEEMDVVQKITPRENRVVFFNGFQFHSSSTPTKTTYRLVLSFNFTEKDNRNLS